MGECSLKRLGCHYCFVVARRSAHERLFGTKPNQPPENTESSSDATAQFSGKLGSLERSQNSKSVSFAFLLIYLIFVSSPQDSLSSYDSFNNNNNNQKPQSRIIPNAHDDLKTTLSKIEPGSPNVQSGGPSQPRNRWEQPNHRHERLGSKLDLKYVMPPSVEATLDSSPRNSMERTDRSSAEREQQQYRYARSPGKGRHVETKTDYGKYSRNNSSAQDYARSSHQDLTQAHLSVPMKNSLHHSNGFENGGQHMQSPQNTYKPVPPPKPKNYKPPYKGQPPGYAGADGMMQPPLPYQHGKSHSNPVVGSFTCKWDSCFTFLLFLFVHYSLLFSFFYFS